MIRIKFLLKAFNAMSKQDEHLDADDLRAIVMILDDIILQLQGE